jgi:hypothetical protein
VFQFFDLGFKFGDRLLEIEEIHCHRARRIQGTFLISQRTGKCLIRGASPFARK